jgi:hypothetical protein
MRIGLRLGLSSPERVWRAEKKRTQVFGPVGRLRLDTGGSRSHGLVDIWRHQSADEVVGLLGGVKHPLASLVGCPQIFASLAGCAPGEYPAFTLGQQQSEGNPGVYVPGKCRRFGADKLDALIKPGPEPTQEGSGPFLLLRALVPGSKIRYRSGYGVTKNSL